MKTNFNNQDVLKRFTSLCTSFQIHHDDLMADDGKELPLNSLDDFNQGIAVPFGYGPYTTEKGALNCWDGMVKGYRDGVAIQNNAEVKRDSQEEAAALEAAGETTESKEAEAALKVVEATITTIAGSMLATFRKADSDYAWHGLVIPCREFITLGRKAGRNSVETMAEVRAHIYDLASYQSKPSADKKEGKDVDLDADINNAFEVNKTFENNVTRAVKCALLSERGNIDLTIGEYNGRDRLMAPFNQVSPIIKAGGKEVANSFTHLVPVPISEMEALYAETFRGKKRGAKAKATKESVADAAVTVAANVAAYDDMKPDLKGDIDTAVQELMQAPAIVQAALTGDNGVKIIKTFTEGLENIALTDLTVEALVDLASAIDVIVDGYEGTKEGEEADKAQA